MRLGHTILHELTHLDVLGQKAGLTPDEDNRHGTIDPQENPELEGARDFLDDYEKKKKDTSPDYNAESYAAAASGKILIELPIPKFLDLLFVYKLLIVLFLSVYRGLFHEDLWL